MNNLDATVLLLATLSLDLPYPLKESNIPSGFSMLSSNFLGKSKYSAHQYIS